MEKLMENVIISEDGCFVWQGALTSGYGSTTYNSKSWRSHRLSYTLTKGPIREGLVIDHLCRNRACINPDHLEAVPQRINVLRGDTARKDNICKRGHKVVGDNVW